jgi:hypothetical protein
MWFSVTENVPVEPQAAPRLPEPPTVVTPTDENANVLAVLFPVPVALAAV